MEPESGQLIRIRDSRGGKWLLEIFYSNVEVSLRDWANLSMQKLPNSSRARRVELCADPIFRSMKGLMFTPMVANI
jgi:hypothetical protein